MTSNEWQHHVQSFKPSSLTKRAYTRLHHLTYSQLLDYEALLPWNIDLPKVVTPLEEY